MHLPTAKFRLGGVKVDAIPDRIDKRFDWIRGGRTGDKFFVSAPPSRMARDPNVDGQIAQHSNAAFDVGGLFRILRCRQSPQIAGADDIQYSIAVVNLERP